MRHVILSLLLTAALYSQAQQITGVTKDEKGTPFNGASVSLMKDSSIIKLAVTSVNGTFHFSGIKEGTYKVMITYIGYQPASSPLFTFSSSDVTLADISLYKVTGDLNKVIVTAKKPLVEVKSDRMILNVEGTINSIGSNALELLRKSPGVLLDKDDNISLAGKNGVQVYVDGRPNPLTGQELANYLKTLQSSQVEAIELITNPSAKYEAAGNAGIINIRLLKNKSFGTNGSVNAGWNIGINAKYNAGFTLNYRNRKINLFSTYSYSYAPNQQHIDFKRMVLDSLFDQRGSIEDLRKAHNFKIGADYFLNKKNTIGIIVNGILSDPTSNTNGKTYISNTTTRVIDRLLIADNDVVMERDNANINLNYSYTGTKGNSLVVNADRGNYVLNSDQFQRNYYYDPTEQVKQGNSIYHIISPSNIYIKSIKADYEQNFMKGKLGIGGKSGWIKTDNNFQQYNVNGAVEDLDKDRSNHFLYKENIHAGYVNYNRKYKGFMMQVGMRVENTMSEGISSAVSSFKRSYTDFFPSVAITFNKNPKKQWGLSYSRRIDRPAYKDLNPFEFKMDEYTFIKGNINLRPQYTNNFAITHSYKFKLNTSLTFSHVKDMFTTLFDTVQSSKAFVSKKNLATQDIVSLNVSYPFQYKAYSLFANMSTNYSVFKADFGGGRKVDLDAFGFNLFVQNSIKFAKTLTAELSGFYNAPTIMMGSFKSKSMFGIDAGISKVCLDGKANLKVSVSDVFYSQKFRASTDFAGQSMRFNFRQESRQFKISFNYWFGSNQVKAARQRTTGAEEETKRVQQSNGVF